MSRRPGYKWIAAEIERLDPETDFERIWALSTTYWVDDFMMNFLYTVGFPHFILPPHGGQTVGRKSTGPLLTEPQKREQETVHHFWTWFEHGPSSPHTRASVDRVNRIHAAIGKSFPGNYAHNDDFVYTLCWIAAYMHNLRLQVGLPGYTRNQQVADRWFPRGLRAVGRTLILSFYDEPVRRVHRTGVPNRATIRTMELGLKMYLLAKERVLPDPKVSTPERARRSGRGTAAKTAVP